MYCNSPDGPVSSVKTPRIPNRDAMCCPFTAYAATWPSGSNSYPAMTLARLSLARKIDNALALGRIQHQNLSSLHLEPIFPTLLAPWSQPDDPKRNWMGSALSHRRPRDKNVRNGSVPQVRKPLGHVGAEGQRLLVRAYRAARRKN